MKAPLIIVSLVMSLLLAGCETTATTPVQVQRSTAVIEGSKDQIWPHLVSQIGLDYPVRAIEKESGFITTDFVTMPAGFNNMHAGQWVVPPGGFLATWRGLRMNMKVMAVETEPGRTRVTINCHYEAFEDNVSKSWVVARSNGAIENKILTNVERAVASAPKVSAPVAVAKQPASETPTARSMTPADGLLELKKLHDAGAITDEEYATKKKALLDRL